jgi:hypothetical protein
MKEMMNSGGFNEMSWNAESLGFLKVLGLLVSLAECLGQNRQVFRQR